MTERGADREQSRERQPIVGGRYRHFEGTEYIVDGLGFNVDDYGITGELHPSVFYHQVVAGKMPVGTQYSLRKEAFMGTTIHEGQIVSTYEFLENTNVKIVQLTPDSWQVLKDIKIQSTTLEPIAFEDQEPGLERYRERTEAEWRDKLDEEKSRTVSVFARDGENYVGMVSGVMKSNQQEAEVQHMYTDPDYRGQKVGGKLLDALLFELWERHIYLIKLWVVIDQNPAIKLYGSRGFKEAGRQERVKRGKTIVTEIEMALEL